MSKIVLTKRELKEVFELFEKMHETDYATVTLERANECEIGSNLTATIYITHKDVEGNFTVTITDETDW